MKPKLELVIDGLRRTPIRIVAGDTLDLGDGGVIVWYDGDEAEALRLQQKARAAKIREVVAHVREQSK